MKDDAGNDQRWPPKEGPTNFEPSKEAKEFVSRRVGRCNFPWGDCEYKTAAYPIEVLYALRRF